MNATNCLRALNEPSASIFLLLLLSGDLIYIVLHFLNAFALNSTYSLLSLERDRGYPEMYQYLKFCWIVALLLLITWKKRTWHYVIWMGVFLCFLADDSLQIHERIGRSIAANLDFIPPLGLRLQDLGELAFSATVGSFLLIPLILAYMSGSRVFKKTSQDIFLLILLLIFFGIVVDMGHIAINLGRKVEFILGVIEDGGEMLTVSLMAWYFFLLSVRSDMSSCYLCDFMHMVLTKTRIVFARKNTPD